MRNRPDPELMIADLARFPTETVGKRAGPVIMAEKSSKNFRVDVESRRAGSWPW